MKQSPIDVLEECIKSLEEGMKVEECLKKYPDMTQELRDFLNLAAEMESLNQEKASSEQIFGSRSKVLAQAKILREREKPTGLTSIFDQVGRRSIEILSRLSPLKLAASRLVLALGLTILLVIFSSGLLITSAKSLPGESLYPVKRAVEDLRVYLVPKLEERQSYEDNYSQQRVEEVKQLIGLRRAQQISFEGTVESINDNDWMVGGIPVKIQPDTALNGVNGDMQSFEAGMLVEVEGSTNPQGWVEAREIHLREYRFIGVVDEINAESWIISGIRISIDADTQIEPGIQINQEVTVLVRSDDNGIFALAILRYLQPTATSGMVPSTVDSESISERATETMEEDQLSGTVDDMRVNYWVVGGQIVYIVSDTQLPEGIQPGDRVTIHYRIEANGSLTAIEIEKTENNDQPEEYQQQETPESEGAGELIATITPKSESTEAVRTPEYSETADSEHQETPTVITTDSHETEESVTTPQPSETLQPSETSQPSETQQPSETPEPENPILVTP